MLGRSFSVLASVSLALTLGFAAAAAGEAAPSFARAKTQATGTRPDSVTIGDLNRDGNPDLAVTNTGTEEESGTSVSVLLGRGNGTFQPKVDYETGSLPVTSAIGDLNGDHKPDLVTANIKAGTVSVLFNEGGGTFQAKVDYPTGGGTRSVAIGDLNGDRRPDLAVASIDTNRVSVLLNRGGGRFRRKYSLVTGRSPFSLGIRDLNGDHALDVATVNQDASTVSVLLNKGHGAFRARRDYATAEDDESDPESLAIGDLNGDRRPDLVTANAFESTISVFLNRGDGTFRAKRDYRTGYNSTPRWVAIGDLNSDGKRDLAIAEDDPNTVSVLLNRGNGTFEPRVDFATGRGPVAVAVGDLNGDRRTDLVTANAKANTVSLLVNTPGLCTVQKVRANLLPAAERRITSAGCRVGNVTRGYSKAVERGRVISQSPAPGTVLPRGARVSLLVSRGRRR
jgi:hypothetical protein